MDQDDSVPWMVAGIDGSAQPISVSDAAGLPEYYAHGDDRFQKNGDGAPCRKGLISAGRAHAHLAG